MELAIYNAFRKAGVEEEAAKAIAENLNATFNTTVSKAIERNVDLKQLATKGDIEQLRLEIEKVRLETKADIGRVEANIIKWMFGAIVAAAGIAMAIARLFFTAA